MTYRRQLGKKARPVLFQFGPMARRGVLPGLDDPRGA